MAAERRAEGVRIGSGNVSLNLPPCGHAWTRGPTRYGRASGSLPVQNGTMAPSVKDM
ncbi:hypothetical protein LNAOJCKE_0744 [Methylorubrum aminovorans]|uniref:Uncharacterized protein n=1 Tax=Methylorubrum aminovorans TaxID=269069 RepID=A0ABQ4UAR3_9HYPH|nr:hypothetical protein LNAOJCKE_0744 [Methylorubrum aminovorans]